MNINTMFRLFGYMLRDDTEKEIISTEFWNNLKKTKKVKNEKHL